MLHCSGLPVAVVVVHIMEMEDLVEVIHQTQVHMLVQVLELLVQTMVLIQIAAADGLQQILDLVEVVTKPLASPVKLLVLVVLVLFSLHIQHKYIQI
jgi:hypothetical protein